MESPRLTYPTQQQGQHLLVETETAELKNWLKSLPYGDMGRAVPEVCRAIASLNRTQISQGQRKELVALFDKTYSQIFEAYRPNAPHIVSAEIRRKEHNQLHQLTREMAFAHKIVTDGEVKKRKLFGKNKDLIRSINLSLHYLGILLMEHYESYSPIPVYLWRECNGLYAYAQKKQIEDVKVFEDGYFQCLPTIEQTFARTCLMSLSDPYHLSQGEHWQLYKYLERWSYLCEFSEDQDDFSESQCFVVLQNSQLKPEYSAQYDGDPMDDDACFMLTVEVIRQLRYHLDELSQSDDIPEGFYKSIRPASARSLLEHMAAHWNAKVERKGRRYPVITRLDIIWGVHPIHTLLQKHRVSPDSTHWDASTISSFLEQEHSVPLKWDASNVSDGGIGISTHKNIAHQLRVGELVIIREYIDKKPSFRWRPAICRWLFGDENQGTNAGLEFIDGTLEPCRMNNKLAKSKHSAGQVALLFRPHGATLDDPTSIVATRGTYKDGRDFILRLKNKIENIKTRKRTIVTPCIELFQYQTFEVVEVEEESEEDKLDEGVIPWTSIPNYEDSENDKENPNEINLDSIRLPGDH